MLIVEMETTGKIEKKGKKRPKLTKNGQVQKDGNIKLKTDFNTLSISV